MYHDLDDRHLACGLALDVDIATECVSLTGSQSLLCLAWLLYRTVAQSINYEIVDCTAERSFWFRKSDESAVR